MINQTIKISITPTLQDIAREVEWVGFSYWYHDRQEAEMLCRIWMIDSEGNRLKNADLAQGRTVRISISNRNRVTSEGVTIPMPTEENKMQEAWDNGIPEYDFYFGAFMLQADGTPLDVIVGSLQLMAQLKDENNLTRFDRP
jgi:hypothetical protein